MSTVVLDASEKHSVLVDLNEYLHPSTPRWYASRGIPLRRGYLFHGPPGTGKTSFSFALAGVFGLDIYVISLQDINVTEEDLAVLFTQLPRRCIVLLEDIDTAGLRRDAEEDESDDDEKESEENEGQDKSKKDKVEDSSKTNGDMVNGTEKKKKKSKSKKEKHDDSDDDAAYLSEEERRTKGRRGRAGGRSRAVWDSRRDPRNMGMTRALAPPESISLSGLLNAIDGVASHEGRVLIMTTNKPESLDEALIRPGRVDMQVAFTKATGSQATELFHRMYEGTQPRMTPSRRSAGTDKSSASGANEKQKKSTQVAPQEVNGEGKEEISPADLKDLSQKFGKLVPADTFSPAEIQGFLLKRKKTPEKALEDADDWIEATLRQKEARSKVVTVQ
jgi:chaperone BCS1